MRLALKAQNTDAAATTCSTLAVKVKRSALSTGGVMPAFGAPSLKRT
jgi:hypothetical protein